MKTITEKKFQITTAFAFMANAINDEKSQLGKMAHIAKGIIDAAQTRTDISSKMIGSSLFFHNLQDLTKNVLCSYHDSISPIHDEDLTVGIDSDDKGMLNIRPVVFPAIFLILLHWRYEFAQFYNLVLKKKITHVIRGNDLNITFHAKDQEDAYFDFRGDVNPDGWIKLNDFLAGTAEMTEKIDMSFRTLRLINARKQSAEDGFKEYPGMYGNIKPVHPFVSFTMDAECMSFKIENAFKSE